MPESLVSILKSVPFSFSVEIFFLSSSFSPCYFSLRIRVLFLCSICRSGNQSAISRMLTAPRSHFVFVVVRSNTVSLVHILLFFFRRTFLLSLVRSFHSFIFLPLIPLRSSRFDLSPGSPLYPIITLSVGFFISPSLWFRLFWAK